MHTKCCFYVAVAGYRTSREYLDILSALFVFSNVTWSGIQTDTEQRNTCDELDLVKRCYG